MESEHNSKRWIYALTKLRPYLCGNILDDDVDNIMDYLFSEDKITVTNRQQIIHRPTTKDKVSALLDIVVQIGDEACYIFARYFRDNTHGNLPNIWRAIDQCDRKLRETSSLLETDSSNGIQF